eukprot:COSAG02_NODE_1896_length_10463_cov_8.034253_5_plen_114_part_00
MDWLSAVRSQTIDSVVARVLQRARRDPAAINGGQATWAVTSTATEATQTAVRRVHAIDRHGVLIGATRQSIVRKDNAICTLKLNQFPVSTTRRHREIVAGDLHVSTALTRLAS